MVYGDQIPIQYVVNAVSGIHDKQINTMPLTLLCIQLFVVDDLKRQLVEKLTKAIEGYDDAC